MEQIYEPLLDEERPSNSSLWVKRITIILIVSLVLVGIGYVVKSLMKGGDAQPKKKMTMIALKDLPPPPPPPPPKEQPKEQPKDQPKEVKVEQPKPVETPPAEVLKMEGAAGDGPSPFAAGAVNNEYKGGPTADTIGGGPNKHQFDWYTGLIKEKIEDAISKDKDLATGNYKLVLKVWVEGNGHIQKYELVSSTGDLEKDALVKKALDGMAPLTEMPPGDMPQPIKLRVTARSMG